MNSIHILILAHENRSMKNRPVKARVGWSFAMLVLSASHVAAAEPCLEVKAQAGKGADARPFLEFTITNACGFDVSLSPAGLPWGSWWSIKMEAVEEAPPQRALQKPGFLYHDSGERVTLSSGAQLSGAIDMGVWFPEFANVNRTSGIAVHWSYSFPEELKMGWVAGVTVFPRASGERKLR